LVSQFLANNLSQGNLFQDSLNLGSRSPVNHNQVSLSRASRP
jgi:hypothetical protein